MIGALILAAGYSRRFGKPKLSESLNNGSSLLEQVLQNTQNIFDDRLVITRSELKNLIHTLHQHQVAYRCLDSTAGISDSIAFGISQISQKTHNSWDACVICLADMPLIESNTYQSVYNTLKTNKTDSIIVAPSFRDKNNDIVRGHPVGFSRPFFNALSGLSGDNGAQQILKKNPTKLSLIAVNDRGILIDFDTQADFEYNYF